ncbi:MAG: hypothetical protein ABL927_11275 [Bdellovibrionales bacterium]
MFEILNNKKNGLTSFMVFISAFLSVIIFTTVATAKTKHSSQIGLGIVVGDPTGISANYFLDNAHSIDAALAWSDSFTFHLHGDYLLHKPRYFFVENKPIGLYYGIGARLRSRKSSKFASDEDGIELGARAPVGLKYVFFDPRIEIFGELSAVFDVMPKTALDFDIGVGARYYF